MTSATFSQGLRIDPAPFVRRDGKGASRLELAVKGMRCAGCIAKIERGIAALPGVEDARVNLSTAKLSVRWREGRTTAETIVASVNAFGFEAFPYDPDALIRHDDDEGRLLLRCLAVAGFAASNVMFLSICIWAGLDDEMGPGTRTLLHWISGLIAVPAALYAGRPFFRSAFASLAVGRANMDVPISLAVFLTLGSSVAETLQQGEHAYFDGITMLLFFLLIGRYLDHRLRERARTAARELLALQATTAVRIGADGHTRAVPARDVIPGDRLLLAPGERAPVDCVIEQGLSDIDLSMLTGETLPQAAGPGHRVAAGSINLSQALVVQAVARVDESAVAELARLIETGEQSRASFVRLADRAAALYVPVVHSLAWLTFAGWLLGPLIAHALGFEMAAIGVRGALMNAVAVLIITCPCALGLAVPAVQVVATGRLFKRGVLVKSGDALERLAQTDVVIFDKTGTLTLGKPRLETPIEAEALQAAAALARASRHPLSRAIAEAAGVGAMADAIRETPGEGIEGVLNGRRARLGRRVYAAPEAADVADGAPELWFAIEGAPAVRFVFADALRADAAEVIRALAKRGIAVELLSGDRPVAAGVAARAAGIEHWRGGVSPADKTARLAELRAQGKRTLMVGDGLNDAAALAGAHVSASPGSALDISQAASDIVIQGAMLMPLVEGPSLEELLKRAMPSLGQRLALFREVVTGVAAIHAAGLIHRDIKPANVLLDRERDRARHGLREQNGCLRRYTAEHAGQNHAGQKKDSQIETVAHRTPQQSRRDEAVIEALVRRQHGRRRRHLRRHRKNALTGRTVPQEHLQNHKADMQQGDDDDEEVGQDVHGSVLHKGGLRRCARNAGAKHLAPLTVIVVERVVLRRAIVPDRQRAFGPAHPAGQILVRRVPINMLQQGLGVRRTPTLEAHRIDGIEIKRLPPAFRMRDHRRVHALAKRLVGRRDRRRHLVFHPVEIAAGAVGRTRRMHCAQSLERRLQPVGQSLKGQILILKQRIAAEFGNLVGVEQGEARRFRQIGQVRMPSVGEVQLVVAFLQHADNEGPVGQGLDERRHHPPAQIVRHPLQIVERHFLIRHGDHQMIDQSLTQARDFLARELSRQVDAANLRAQGARQSRNHERHADL